MGSTGGFGVDVEIYSDPLCPWCYLGTRRLDAALAPFAADVVLRWRAFQLDPDLPRHGRPLLDWLGPRLGGEARARQVMAHLAALGAVEGIRFNFDRALIVNSFDAHRLLWFADQPESVVAGGTADTQPALAEALYRAHFTNGLDIGSPPVLVDLAEKAGLDPDRVHRLLASTEGTPEVRGQVAMAHDLGITGVPTFVFAGRYRVTGAHDAATLRSVLTDVARREGLLPATGSQVPGQRTSPATEDGHRVV